MSYHNGDENLNYVQVGEYVVSNVWNEQTGNRTPCRVVHVSGPTGYSRRNFTAICADGTYLPGLSDSGARVRCTPEEVLEFAVQEATLRGGP